MSFMINYGPFRPGVYYVGADIAPGKYWVDQFFQGFFSWSVFASPAVVRDSQGRWEGAPRWFNVYETDFAVAVNYYFFYRIGDRDPLSQAETTHLDPAYVYHSREMIKVKGGLGTDPGLAPYWGIPEPAADLKPSSQPALRPQGIRVRDNFGQWMYYGGGSRGVQDEDSQSCPIKVCFPDADPFTRWVEKGIVGTQRTFKVDAQPISPNNPGPAWVFDPYDESKPGSNAPHLEAQSSCSNHRDSFFDLDPIRSFDTWSFTTLDLRPGMQFINDYFPGNGYLIVEAWIYGLSQVFDYNYSGPNWWEAYTDGPLKNIYLDYASCPVADDLPAEAASSNYTSSVAWYSGTRYRVTGRSGTDAGNAVHAFTYNSTVHGNTAIAHMGYSVLGGLVFGDAVTQVFEIPIADSSYADRIDFQLRVDRERATPPPEDTGSSMWVAVDFKIYAVCNGEAVIELP